MGSGLRMGASRGFHRGPAGSGPRSHRRLAMLSAPFRRRLRSLRREPQRPPPRRRLPPPRDSHAGLHGKSTVPLRVDAARQYTPPRGGRVDAWAPPAFAGQPLSSRDVARCPFTFAFPRGKRSGEAPAARRSERQPAQKGLSQQHCAVRPPLAPRQRSPTRRGARYAGAGAARPPGAHRGRAHSACHRRARSRMRVRRPPGGTVPCDRHLRLAEIDDNPLRNSRLADNPGAVRPMLLT